MELTTTKHKTLADSHTLEGLHTRNNNSTKAKVRRLKARGIHANYINISRLTYTQTPMPLHK